MTILEDAGLSCLHVTGDGAVTSYELAGLWQGDGLLDPGQRRSTVSMEHRLVQRVVFAWECPMEGAECHRD
jgi:hypothetical protein